MAPVRIGDGARGVATGARLLLAAHADAANAGQSPAAAGGAEAFEPAFFAQFRPTTAYDMVQRLPGFDFSGGDAVRGFGGAAGNVLIDGRRPASKSDALSDILSRIPAGDVVRIDLVRAGAGGVDMQGYAVLANVVRRTGATISGQNTFAIVLFPDDPTTYNAGADYTRRWDGRTLELSVFANSTLSTAGNADGERIRTGAGPHRAAIEGEAIRYNANARAAYATPWLGGALSLRGLVSWARPTTDEWVRYDTGATERFETEAPRIGGELGLGYARPFGERTRAELVLLARRDRTDSSSSSTTGSGLALFDTLSTLDEALARLSLTRRLSDAVTLEGGAEQAFNRLDSATDFTLNGQPRSAPNAIVTVSETRSEVFGALRWAARANLSVEAGLRVERSRLEEQGDVDLTKSFTFAKPRLIAAWSPTAQDQIRLRLDRRIGQLDFNDFAASASFSTGTVDAGNAELEPDKRWVAELGWERRLLGTGSLSVTATHERIEDVLDRVPVQGFDAVGNIGDGVRNMVRADLTLPLDRLGVPNAQGGLEMTSTRSSVDDPITGRERRISGETPFSAKLTFSQELRSLNARWGFDLTSATESVAHRVFESRRTGTGANLSVFAEKTLPRGFTLYAFAANMIEDELVRDRLVYTGLRDVTEPAFREVRRVRYPPWIYIRLRRSF
ncbi:MAG TPA: TonB-dependent receptor [Brevundimonas sp.]|nr:TonB-dependent receptor [Brevundimonas sp.]